MLGRAGKEMDMMTPTVGRVVYFNQGTKDDPKLLAAIIAHVWSEIMVNLMVIDPNGNTYSKTSIHRGSEGNQWDWMPYQKQKASEGNHNSESAEPRPETRQSPLQG